MFKIKKFTFSISVLVVVILVALVGPPLYPKLNLSLYAGTPDTPPSNEFPLGTDRNGRDILSHLLIGIRTSLYVGVIATIIALTIGILVGSFAGFKGGVIDEILMMITNIIYTLPAILLMILIASYLKERSPLFVSIVIGVTSWPWLARAVRAQIMSLKEREFVQMSKMSGLKGYEIIFKDLLPNMASYIFMSVALLLSISMLAEAGLSMIGAGIDPSTESSLGVMLQRAQQGEAIRLGRWWCFVPPGIVLVLITTSLLMLSTSIDEYFNPRLRGGK
ncbi:MAG: ABC transporter permease [Candidatus Brockarchaeota archaeon]|nr:ABC transporter permease [Candidatus Brockarchaeota archaeon]